MRFSVLLIFIVCGALSGASARAETLQHGNIIYTLPPDWTTGRLQDGIRTLIYDPADDVCEFCYAYLGAGAPKSGRLADHVARMAPLFLETEDRATATVLQSPSLAPDGPLPIAMTALANGDELLVVIGYELSTRFEIVAFAVDGGHEGEDIAANLARLQGSIVPMFDALSFVSEGAVSLMPEPVPGPLDGVWWGTYLANRLGLDMQLSFEVDHRYLVFWRDGYFYDGTPPQGTQPLDASLLQDAADPDFGTYRVEGATLTLTYATGRTEVLGLAENQGITDADRTLYPAELVPTGTRLNGGLSSFFYSGFTPGAGIEGGVSGGSDTAFLPDGTYTGSSYGGAFGNFVDGGGNTTGGFTTGGDGAVKGGRYEIVDGLLIQYPDDGSPATKAFVSRADGAILIGTKFLETD